MNWVNSNYHMVSSPQRLELDIMVKEAASIFAADAMCHPRARVGKFDWSDVVALHRIIHTPYSDFLNAHVQQLAVANDQ